MTSKYPLRARYEAMAPGSHTEIINAERLFCDILGVRNCDWNDLIQELVELRNDNCEDFDSIHNLYVCLARFMTQMSKDQITEIK
jgi:hypothetical protein